MVTILTSLPKAKSKPKNSNLRHVVQPVRPSGGALFLFECEDAACPEHSYLDVPVWHPLEKPMLCPRGCRAAYLMHRNPLNPTATPYFVREANVWASWPSIPVARLPAARCSGIAYE